VAKFIHKGTIVMKTVRAHYDGKQVLLDEPLPLKENDELLVTLVEDINKGVSRNQLQGLTGSEMKRLMGIVSLGGDALEDSENLYS
jgi:hypothetical protein